MRWAHVWDAPEEAHPWEEGPVCPALRWAPGSRREALSQCLNTGCCILILCKRLELPQYHFLNGSPSWHIYEIKNFPH